MGGTSVIILLGLGFTDEIRADREVCGLNCLVLIDQFLQDGKNYEEIVARLPVEKAPFSLHELQQAAEQIGYNAWIVKWQDVNEATFECPSILYIKGKNDSLGLDHFIPCFGETSQGLCFAEFPGRPAILNKSRLPTIWQGDMLYIEGAHGNVVNSLKASIQWNWYFKLSFVVTAAVALGILLTRSLRR